MSRDIQSLSFVHAPKRGKGVSFWNVKSTGDYSADNQIGEHLALEYLAFEEADKGGPGHLQIIVSDMPRDLTRIEISFLAMVSFAAGAGADRARRISAYWDQCREKHAKLEQKKVRS